MCQKLIFVLSLLVLSSALYSDPVLSDPSVGNSTPTPKEQVLSSLDDLQKSMQDLQQINKEQGTLLLSQSQQLTKLKDSLSFIGLENNILIGATVVLAAISIAEAIVIHGR